MDMYTERSVRWYGCESFPNKSIQALYATENFVKNNVWKGAAVAKNIINYNKKMEVTDIIDSIPDTKTQTVCNVSTILINALISINKYNPVKIMAQSDNSYVRKPTRFMQQQLNEAILYILRKPKYFAKLMEALGAPVSINAHTALSLEETVDECFSMTVESVDKYLTLDIFIAKPPGQVRAKLLLAILNSLERGFDESALTFIKKTVEIIMIDAYGKTKKCVISFLSKQKNNISEVGNCFKKSVKDDTALKLTEDTLPNKIINDKQPISKRRRRQYYRP
ncbi:MAG: hypothetical protein QS721_13225 [Candidatus Endonucleobacter sp. (ex Gigantidas childressi)]|nr:hypothetical protein [Candidatus Endonucleobacter sp. (ex Gigantidas childressi)]